MTLRINEDRMINVLGPAPKPEHVWEKQFDDFNEALASFVKMDWQEIPEKCLWYYFHDLAYMELQPDLFRYLFPVCLKFWYQTLMRNEGTGRGDTDLHYGLMRGNVLEKMLSAKERASLYDFFHDGFLDRIEAQNCFCSPEDSPDAWRSLDAWIYRFNSLGIIVPLTERIWQSWWDIDHPGKAICAIMYASGLIYLKGENPIYSVWTPEKGGGGPYLTEIDSALYDWAWKAENLTFLKNTLSVDYVINKLEFAAQALSNTTKADIARRIAYDALAKREVMALRIDDLLENLARVQLEKDLWDGNKSRKRS